MSGVRPVQRPSRGVLLQPARDRAALGHLYDVIGLQESYQRDLSARINDAAVKSTVSVAITAKLNLIRKVGNAAAHEDKPIQQHAARQVLRELFHVVVFAAYRFSTDPPRRADGRSVRHRGPAGLPLTPLQSRHRGVVDEKRPADPADDVS